MKMQKLLSICCMLSMTLFISYHCGSSSSGSASNTPTIVVSGTTANAKLISAIYSNNPNAKNPNQQYELVISSDNLCAWASAHDSSLGEQTGSELLAVSLLNLSSGTLAAPIAGTYNVATPASDATGLFIDPNTAGLVLFDNISETGICTANFSSPQLGSGTLTVTSVGTSGATLVGNMNIALLDGTTLIGNFSAVSTCTGYTVVTPPSVDPNLCTW